MKFKWLIWPAGKTFPTNCAKIGQASDPEADKYRGNGWVRKFNNNPDWWIEYKIQDTRPSKVDYVIVIPYVETPKEWGEQSL